MSKSHITFITQRIPIIVAPTLAYIGGVVAQLDGTTASAGCIVAIALALAAYTITSMRMWLVVATIASALTGSWRMASECMKTYECAAYLQKSSKLPDARIESIEATQGGTPKVQITLLNGTFRAYLIGESLAGCHVGDHICGGCIRPIAVHSRTQSWSLLRSGVHAMIFTQGNPQWIIRPTPQSNSLLRNQLDAMSARIQTAFGSLSPETATLANALFLGNTRFNAQCLEQLRSTCTQWGINHFLARSGIHLSIIAGCALGAMRYFPIHITLQYLVVLICILCYSLLTICSVSYYRALWMMCVYIAALVIARPPNILHSVCLVTLGTLLWNPALITALDFQLSFGLTVILALFTHGKHIATQNS